MSTRETSSTPEPAIESFEQLIAPMRDGEKPKDQWRIGTEHEKLVYMRGDHHAPSYEEKGGIQKEGNDETKEVKEVPKM